MFKLLLSVLLIVPNLINGVVANNVLGNPIMEGIDIIDNYGSNISIDFALEYEGLTYPNKTTNLRYSSDNTNILYSMTFNNNIEGAFNDCLRNCANNDDCVSVYIELEDELLDINEDYSGEDLNLGLCTLLSYSGEPVNTDTFSYSYSKFRYYHNINSSINTDGNNTINGYLLSINNGDRLTETTIYIDNNYNGEFDPGELSTVVYNSDTFKFSNLSSGNYLLRMVHNDPYCNDIIPNINGSYVYYTDGDGMLVTDGLGYVDSVISYFHNGHMEPHGSYIDSNGEIHTNANFSFILGGNNNTYLSFYDEDNITLKFIDETITPYKHDFNLFIETYNSINSTIYANVSVSTDGYNYYWIGILGMLNYSNNTHHINELHCIQKFNTSISGLTTPISYISLNFFNSQDNDNNYNDTIQSNNIIRIYGNHNDTYSPPYSIYATIPIYDNRGVLMVTNCDFVFNCESNCLYIGHNYSESQSCNYGCALFERYNYNLCTLGPNGTSINYKQGIDFNKNMCDQGFLYAINKYTFPYFVVLQNMSGYDYNTIDIIEYCETDCLDRVYKSCLDDDNCTSFSLSTDHNLLYGDLYNTTERKQGGGTLYAIRKELYDLELISTTPTSTLTTTPTSTLTTTPTTTLTTTQTSTITTTPTSTITTTQTSTQTTTQTTKQIIPPIINYNNMSSNNLELIYIILSIIGGCLLLLLCVFIIMIHYKYKKYKNINDSRQSSAYNNPLYAQSSLYNDDSELNDTGPKYIQEPEEMNNPLYPYDSNEFENLNNDSNVISTNSGSYNHMSIDSNDLYQDLASPYIYSQERNDSPTIQPFTISDNENYFNFNSSKL